MVARATVSPPNPLSNMPIGRSSTAREPTERSRTRASVLIQRLGAPGLVGAILGLGQVQAPLELGGGHAPLLEGADRTRRHGLERLGAVAGEAELLAEGAEVCAGSGEPVHAEEVDAVLLVEDPGH